MEVVIVVLISGLQSCLASVVNHLKLQLTIVELGPLFESLGAAGSTSPPGALIPDSHGVA